MPGVGSSLARMTIRYIVYTIILILPCGDMGKGSLSAQGAICDPSFLPKGG